MRVFIINLKRSTQRKELMQNKIAALLKQHPNLKNELEFVFFEAVDATSGELSAFQSLESAQNFIFGRALSEGEKGCFASHYKLWQSCVDLNEKMMILEDDIELSPDFNQANIQNITQSNYEYIRFCYLFERKIYALSEHFFISFAQVNGTQGYFITPSAAKKFIKHAKFSTPVDVYMDTGYIHDVLNIIYKPLLVKETSAQSEIDTLGRTKITLKPHQKLCRELFRVLANVRKIAFAARVLLKLKLKKL